MCKECLNHVWNSRCSGFHPKQDAGSFIAVVRVMLPRSRAVLAVVALSLQVYLTGALVSPPFTAGTCWVVVGRQHSYTYVAKLVIQSIVSITYGY